MSTPLIQNLSNSRNRSRRLGKERRKGTRVQSLLLTLLFSGTGSGVPPDRGIDPVVGDRRTDGAGKRTKSLV